MSFMELVIFRKGATYCCDCDKCCATLYTHEWAHSDHNERRDAMAAGTLSCDYCSGHGDPETFQKLPNQYADWHSASGYLDCTELEFDTNKRRLGRTLRGVQAA